MSDSAQFYYDPCFSVKLVSVFGFVFYNADDLLVYLVMYGIWVVCSHSVALGRIFLKLWRKNYVLPKATLLKHGIQKFSITNTKLVSQVIFKLDNQVYQV